MNTPWWFSQPNLRRQLDHNTHEMEALQTDVMRFMAILGFCLMTVFALVQSLPVGRSDARPKLEDPTQLAQEVVYLQQQTQQARHQLMKLKNLLTQARLGKQRAIADRQAAERQREQALAKTEQAERAEQRIIQRMQQTDSEFDGISHALDKASRTLQEREQQLASLERQIQARRHTLAELRLKMETQRRALFTTKGRLTVFEQALDQSRERAPQKQVPKPSRQGFHLHFASNAALASLIKAKKVQFYAMLGKRVWHLHPSATDSHFRPSTMPGSFYEMHAHTVPQEYLGAMRKAATVFDAARVTWGVTLPNNTRATVDRLMAQHEGGDLVIQSDGTVTIIF